MRKMGKVKRQQNNKNAERQILYFTHNKKYANLCFSDKTFSAEKN